MGRAAEAATLPVPKWLRNRINVWTRRLGLDVSWQIDIEFKQRVVAGRERCDAVTYPRPGYMTAKIIFDGERYEEMTEAQVDLLIVHELYHLIVARLDDRMHENIGEGLVYKVWIKENELIAEAFAMIMTRAYKRKKD